MSHKLLGLLFTWGEKTTFVGIQDKFCVNIHLIILRKEQSVNTLWMCAGMFALVQTSMHM